MYDYLLSVVSFICLFHAGLCAKECQQGVFARRETFSVPKGGSLSLSCVVQHCGETWTGGWVWENSTYGDSRPVQESQRHHLTNKTVSANETKLLLNILSAAQSDEGSYGCRVSWGKGDREQGHLTYVNITMAVSSPRNLLHRVLVCASASLCLPIILGLARCLSSEVKAQPLPRAHIIYEVAYRDQPTNLAPKPPPRCPVPQKRKASPHKAPPKPQQKSEVVYAVISKDALTHTGADRKPPQSTTVYSSLRLVTANEAQ